MYPIISKVRNQALCRLTLIYAVVACTNALTAVAFATTDVEGEYIDSVYDWGIWELGLEPASGPQAPANNAMNDRSRRLQFRPNDNAAYISQSLPVPAISTVTPPQPAPPAPVIPTIPAGPPGFTSGPPTTADPRN